MGTDEHGWMMSFAKGLIVGLGRAGNFRLAQG